MKTLLILNDAPYRSEEGSTTESEACRTAARPSLVLARRGRKRFNPMLSMSKDAFVDTLTADIPPQPADMARIVEANLRGLASVAVRA